MLALSSGGFIFKYFTHGYTMMKIKEHFKQKSLFDTYVLMVTPLLPECDWFVFTQQVGVHWPTRSQWHDCFFPVVTNRKGGHPAALEKAWCMSLHLFLCTLFFYIEATQLTFPLWPPYRKSQWQTLSFWVTALLRPRFNTACSLWIFLLSWWLFTRCYVSQTF